MMEHFYTILISAIFVNNVILVKFLGLCPFMGVSRNTRSALWMSAAVTLIMTLASLLTWLLYYFVLVPFDIMFLQIVLFIFIIALMVQSTEILMRKKVPAVHKKLGIYLPLITTNCAILGVAFINILEEFSFFSAILYGLGSGIGFTLALVLMSGIREKFDLYDIPEPFKGAPIAFIIAAFMSIVFLGFATLLGL